MGRTDEANDILCKLGWLTRANPVIDCYIPAGTLISDPAVDACGVNTYVQGFDPIDPNLPVFVTVYLELNGTPVTVSGTFTASTLIEAVNLAIYQIVIALNTATSTSWLTTFINGFAYLWCTDYTRNGDTLFIDFIVTQEFQLGILHMDAVLAGGSPPETPEYQTEEMNCLTADEIEDMKIYRNEICNGVCLMPMATITTDDNCN